MEGWRDASPSRMQRYAPNLNAGLQHSEDSALSTPLPRRIGALIFPLTLGTACVATTGRSSAGRDYAYARAGDSIVVAVSTRGRSPDQLLHALDSAVARAARQERCEAGRVQLRGERDTRLADDAVAYLTPPRSVGVALCNARPAR